MKPRLVIIGNGPSADTPKVAEIVAGAELVLRINHFPQGKHLGTRCDIWGSNLYPDWDTPPASAREVWWTAWPYRPGGHNYDKVIASRPGPFAQIAPKWMVDELCQYLRPHEPSTGLVLVRMAIRAGYTPVLAGFDHFAAGPIHYYAEQDPAYDRRLRLELARYHNPPLEASLIRSWQERDLLTFA